MIQLPHFTRSHTVGAVSSSDASGISISPHKLQDAFHVAPNIPHKSSRRIIRGCARDSSVFSSQGNQDGLVRPMSTSSSTPICPTSRPTRRIAKSSTGSVATNIGRGKRDSPIRKGSNSPRKISHSVTSALTSSQDNTSNSVDSGGLLKASRLKTKSVFSKFADVLTDHFTGKHAKKVEDATDNSEPNPTNTGVTAQQIVHGLPSSRLLLEELPVATQDTNVEPATVVEGDEMGRKKAKKIMGGPSKVSTTARKRLTVVDEVEIQNEQALEDPFSESSSGHQTTVFETRLRHNEGHRGPVPTDPFQAENILETSVDAPLMTPPVGCSTPRRRPVSMPRSETPTKASRSKHDHAAGLTAFCTGPSSAHLGGQRITSKPRNNPRKENQKLKDSRGRGSAASTATRVENSVSSDLTRLSSYPPGSTIRHVPRSMGRLTQTPVLSAPDVDGTIELPLRRKKHPSPSKGQLELFGRVMEKNLALGVFKDVDELGASFDSPRLDARTLSPRDTNRQIRNLAASSTDLRKNYTTNFDRTGLPKSRSRIPQPVRQLSRSRTDTAFARDFIPANKGDSTAGDELQWDTSRYNIGHRCNHCGNSGQVV